jgi:pimeloyl-ACP methyl ester carboxylesterase
MTIAATPETYNTPEQVEKSKSSSPALNNPALHISTRQPEDPPDQTDPNKTSVRNKEPASPSNRDKEQDNIDPDYVVRRSSTRSLAVDVLGPEDGVPVFFLHGMPGSRFGPYPRGVVLYRLGVRLIAYDRPGYGNSERSENRSIADTADDVFSIMDHLGIDRFAVIGKSGGGPHALAVAAKFPGLVTSAAVLAGFAPTGKQDLPWRMGMCQKNIDTLSITNSEDDLREHLSQTITPTTPHPERILGEWVVPSLEHPDRRVIENIEIQRQLRKNFLQALPDGNVEGWLDDIRALQRDWEFELGDVKAPTFFWHGTEDRFSPVSHTYWLASKVAHPHLEVAPATGHFGSLEVLPRILSWLVDKHRAITEEPSGSRPNN